MIHAMFKSHKSAFPYNSQICFMGELSDLTAYFMSEIPINIAAFMSEILGTAHMILAVSDL